MSVTISRLSHEDWVVWKAVRLQALADAPDAFGSTFAEWSVADDDRWMARLHDVPLHLIAYRNDDAIGQVSATRSAAPRTVELISMWVSPSARGEGVGDALVEAVVTWAEVDGAQLIELSV